VGRSVSNVYRAGTLEDPQAVAALAAEVATRANRGMTGTPLYEFVARQTGWSRPRIETFVKNICAEESRRRKGAFSRPLAWHERVLGLAFTAIVLACAVAATWAAFSSI
jgi:hypothetical protein